MEEGEGEFASRFFSQVNNLVFSHNKTYLFGAMDDGVTIVDLSADTSLEFNSQLQFDADTASSLTLNVNNDGPAIAHGISVSIDMGTHALDSASITGSNAECSIDSNEPEIALCRIDRMVNGAGEVITLNFTTPSSDIDIPISASATRYELDRNGSNNMADATLQIIAPVPQNPGNGDGDENMTDEVVSDGGGGSTNVFFAIALLFSSIVLRLRK